jgi:predicted DCC family thiol-disulfide oxidoreductase YuxK
MLINAVGRNDEHEVLWLMRELWADATFHAATMAVLPQPIRDYIYREVATSERGFHIGNYGQSD